MPGQLAFLAELELTRPAMACAMFEDETPADRLRGLLNKHRDALRPPATKEETMRGADQ